MEKLYVMEFKILNVEIISDELSLDDLKGGLESNLLSDCCGINIGCNNNDQGCSNGNVK